MQDTWDQLEDIRNRLSFCPTRSGADHGRSNINRPTTPLRQARQIARLGTWMIICSMYSASILSELPEEGFELSSSKCRDLHFL